MGKLTDDVKYPPVDAAAETDTYLTIRAGRLVKTALSKILALLGITVAPASLTFDRSVVMESTLQAGIDHITQAATDTLTAQECRGTVISNYGQAAENTQTLPAAAEGLGGMVVIGTAGAGAFHLKAGASDKIYLDGTALDDADKVSIATPAVGDYFTFFAFQTGASAWDWIVQSGSGTLSDGGA